MIPYVTAKRNLHAFNCPLCNAYAHQTWEKASTESQSHSFPGSTNKIGDLCFAFCSHCFKYTLWFGEKMIYPLVNGAPMPHPDLCDEVKNIYEEARSIVSRSPRSSSALLRVAVEKITLDILAGAGKGNDLNKNIGILVEKGLSGKIQRALDVLRVIGNNAVHPLSQIDFRDDKPTAIKLFEILNLIAEQMIRQPKEVGQIYDNLPGKVIKGIHERDKKGRLRQ